MSVTVIDASTIFSAALTLKGTPCRDLIAARARGVIALLEAVCGEVTEILTQPKFARALTEDQRREVLELLTTAALWAEPTVAVSDCRDAKDNRYLELALAAQAIAVVSGNEDSGAEFLSDIRVVRPTWFPENG